MIKLPQRGGAQSADKRLVEKRKNFEKPLDKACAMWYNVKVVRKRAQKSSLKIEQYDKELTCTLSILPRNRKLRKEILDKHRLR